MSDQTEPQLSASTSTEAAPSAKSSITSSESLDSSNAAPKSSGKGLAVVAILLSLVAVGGSGYNVYTSHFAKQTNQGAILSGVSAIGGDVKVLAERLSQLQREQQRAVQNTVTKNDLQTRLLEVSNKSDLAMRDVNEVQDSLKETLKKLAASSERGADKLALEEVSQLLKLANNSALFSNDASSAINALKLADSQLKQLADPRYAVVRRLINKEINDLEAIKTVDVTSLTAQLSALASRIPSLPLENEPPVVGSVTIVEPETSSQMSVSSELKKLWVQMLNVIKIKRIDQPPKPLLEPEQRYFLDQNIILKLSTAELAIMQTKPKVYQRSLDSAIEWLTGYYDPLDEGVIKATADLNELKKQSFGSDLPSIVASYDALQRIKGGN